MLMKSIKLLSFFSALLAAFLEFSLFLCDQGWIFLGFFQHLIYFCHNFLINSLHLVILDILHHCLEFLYFPRCEHVIDFLDNSCNFYVLANHSCDICQFWVMTVNCTIISNQFVQVRFTDCWVLLLNDVDHWFLFFLFGLVFLLVFNPPFDVFLPILWENISCIF